MWHPRQRQLLAIKAALFALCLAPFAHLVWGVAYDALGANPVEAVTHSTGWWTLFLLCATLAVTPLRRATGANWLQKLRRMLGLYAFFYATLHFITGLIDDYFDRYRPLAGKKPLVNGRDLMRHCGLAPSPIVGELLQSVEEERLAGRITTRREALQHAAACLAHRDRSASETN